MPPATAFGSAAAGGICIFPLLSSNAGGYNSHSSANKQTFRYLIS